MEEENPLVRFVESSFLAEVLRREDVNDVSFNGEAFFAEGSSTGRERLPLEESKEEVGSFLRQIANLSERQFSYLSPILDVSFGRYRLCACFLSLTRVKDQKSYSFSLRVERPGSAVEEDPSFFPKGSRETLLEALNRSESIVIGGETGSGKTELQKYLLLHLPPACRVLVIDSAEELELIRGLSKIDLTTWVIDPSGKGGDVSSLIRAALRFNPDYLVLAEARGGEMFEALSCAMSGHPILLTVHAGSVSSMPSRLARLAQMKGGKMVYEDLLHDVKESFPLYVCVQKTASEKGIVRRISQIGRMEKGEMSILFEEGAKQ